MPECAALPSLGAISIPHMPDTSPRFSLLMVRTVVTIHADDSDAERLARATVKVRVGQESILSVAEGTGPVNAVTQAILAALLQFFPDELATVRLVDYVATSAEPHAETAALVRVEVTADDGFGQWTNEAHSTDIIRASVDALTASLNEAINRIEARRAQS